MNKRQSKGFTLVEMLVATIIMVMVTLCVVTGSSVAQNVYLKSMFMSESDAVSSTLNSAIGDVLHYAVWEGESSDGTIIYFSNVYYTVTKGYFYTKSDGRLYMMPGETLDENKLLSMLGKSAYSGLQLKDFKIEYTNDAEGGYYKGSYTIFHPKDTALKRDITFTFRSLLPPKPITP